MDKYLHPYIKWWNVIAYQFRNFTDDFFQIVVEVNHLPMLLSQLISVIKNISGAPFTSMD